MSILSEFKMFAMRGNVIDLAVGVVVGGAFGKIVTSLVNDIIMPPIGLLTGGVDFNRLRSVLKAADSATAEVAINYGAFVNTMVQFLIIALAVFFAVRAINRMVRQFEPESAKDVPAPPPPQVALLTEIRDLLKDRK